MQIVLNSASSTANEMLLQNLNRNSVCTHFFRYPFQHFVQHYFEFALVFFVISIGIKAMECFKAMMMVCLLVFIFCCLAFFFFPFDILPIAFHKQLEGSKTDGEKKSSPKIEYKERQNKNRMREAKK